MRLPVLPVTVMFKGGVITSRISEAQSDLPASHVMAPRPATLKLSLAPRLLVASTVSVSLI